MALERYGVCCELREWIVSCKIGTSSTGDGFGVCLTEMCHWENGYCMNDKHQRG